MRDQLAQRLETLVSEQEAGRKMLAELDERRAQLTSTLLRIEGAIQVIQEVLRDNPPVNGQVAPPEVVSS